jgi:hypothetical protein
MRLQGSCHLGSFLPVATENWRQRCGLHFEMHRSFALLTSLPKLLLSRSPSFRTMSTSPSAAPFSGSCEKLDALIRKLESDLGVKEPFDVKKCMSVQDKPAVAAAVAAATGAVPQKPAAAAATVAAAAGGAAVAGAAQDAAVAKPKKEKVDKPAAPPKAPPVRTRFLRHPAVSTRAGRSCPRH